MKIPYRRIKVITSHKKNAEFWAETGEDPVGEIPRQDIPSPYEYSPVHPVYEWEGKAVFSVETSHKRYEIFEIERQYISPIEVTFLTEL